MESWIVYQGGRRRSGGRRACHLRACRVPARFSGGQYGEPALQYDREGAGERFSEDSPATQVHPALAPGPDEPVVLKKRVSAFTGSDLEVLLRSGGVTRLVLAGIATSGVVLSTLRETADHDYGLTVLADACADADDEVHRILIEKIFPGQALVITVEEWETALKGG